MILFNIRLTNRKTNKFWTSKKGRIKRVNTNTNIFVVTKKGKYKYNFENSKMYLQIQIRIQIFVTHCALQTQLKVFHLLIRSSYSSPCFRAPQNLNGYKWFPLSLNILCCICVEHS